MSHIQLDQLVLENSVLKVNPFNVAHSVFLNSFCTMWCHTFSVINSILKFSFESWPTRFWNLALKVNRFDVIQSLWSTRFWKTMIYWKTCVSWNTALVHSTCLFTTTQTTCLTRSVFMIPWIHNLACCKILMSFWMKHQI